MCNKIREPHEVYIVTINDDGTLSRVNTTVMSINKKKNWEKATGEDAPAVLVGEGEPVVKHNGKIQPLKKEETKKNGREEKKNQRRQKAKANENRSRRPEVASKDKDSNNITNNENNDKEDSDNEEEEDALIEHGKEYLAIGHVLGTPENNYLIDNNRIPTAVLCTYCSSDKKYDWESKGAKRVEMRNQMAKLEFL